MGSCDNERTNRLTRPSLVYRQNDAFSSCVLQVWQHWPLRWSVMYPGVERGEENVLEDILTGNNRGLFVDRASVLQLLVNPRIARFP